jgi:hypothetical protein
MPSTYTTNGGIELPANGEQSGTWGETVNDNMAIIDRLTNGVGAISLSGTTHTLTTADGTLSDGQYNVLVLGGSPSGTNTITISPNDGEHVYIVKNASGQTATFTQGSGANVSVLNNTTKIIYADGAGAGAAVVDITGALDLGSLIIAGTSVTATAAELNLLDGSIAGTVVNSKAVIYGAAGQVEATTVEFDNLSGTGAVSVTNILDEDNMASDSATALATQQSIKAYVDAQVDTVDTLAEILAIGNTTGGTDLAVSTGDDITFADSSKAIFGAGSDLEIYHDGSNSYILDNGSGHLDIKTNGTEIRLTKTPYEPLLTAKTDGPVELYYDGGTYPDPKLATTATGIDVTGTAVTDGLTVAGNLSVDGGTIKLDGNYPVGTSNVALGNAALDSTDGTADYNTAIGTSALTALTTGDNNVAVGNNSLDALTTGSGNTGIGSSALGSVVTGTNNTAVGKNALVVNTASNNTAVGWQSLYANTTGAANVASGYGALHDNTTGGSNVAIGHEALQNNTTASYNVAVGVDALYANTTGASLAALGTSALAANTTGSYNTALGMNSLKFNTTASNNTAVGYNALNKNTTASYNTAVGYNALYSNTTTTGNTAIGYQALLNNTGSSRQVAVGYRAMENATAAQESTAVGYDALQQVTTGQNNTGIGYNALDAMTTNSNSTALGASAGTAATGASNTFIGASSGDAITTGSKNTILGRYGGNEGGLDIRTASNYIVLSDGDGNPRVIVDSSGNLIVGKTSTSSTVDGVVAYNSGAIEVVRTSNPLLYLNLLTSDGDIAVFRKDGAPVGSIGTDGALNIGSTNTGIKFGTSAVWATTGGSTNSNGAKDLGASTARWKDLYLSGGVYLGGTVVG